MQVEIDTPRWFVPLLAPARYKGVYGGRASGKSHAFAEYVVERHTMAKTDTVCIREVQSSLKLSVKRLIEAKIAKLGLGRLFEVQDKMIKAPYGGLITFTGMSDQTAESIKSLEDFDIGWFEEAQVCSQRSLDLLRPTIRKPGSELLFSWNPRLETDPVDVLLRTEFTSSLPGGAIVVQANYRDNPWITVEMRKEAEYDRARDPDKYSHIWLGGYQRNSEARVFHNWTIDEDLLAPSGATFRYGLDFGFATDPSAGVRCWIDGRDLCVDYEAYGLAVEIDELPEFLTAIPDAHRWPMVADSSRPETISYLRKKGFPKITGAVKGAGSVDEGVEFLKSYNIRVHPRCTHLIDELTLYSYKVDKQTEKVLPVLEDKNNHCIAEGELVACERGEVPIERVTTADRVWTRNGLRQVLFADQTDADRQTVIVETTAGLVRCTPDHEIWIEGRGMTRADALRYGDEVICRHPWTQWNGMVASGRGESDLDISNRIDTIIGTTDGFTAKSGSSTTALFPRAVSFIIATMIRPITRLAIWNALLGPNMAQGTSGLKDTGLSCSRISTAFDRLPRLGMQAKRALKCIAALVRWPIDTLFQVQKHADTALLPFFPVRSAIAIVSAPSVVRRHGGGPLALMTNVGSAQNAVHRFLSIDTAASAPVRDHVVRVHEAGPCARVYDLTVDQDHEFFVNGVLVSNCIDALRYALEGVRRVIARPDATNITIPTMARR